MFKIETIEVDGDADKAFDAARGLVKAQGKYRRIGSGAYGTVYGLKNSDVVYKVGDLSDNEGYLEYIKELAKCKKHNPYTPRIYGVRIYKAKEDDCWGDDAGAFVVAMEKLKPSKRGMHRIVSWFCDELEDNYRRDPAPAELGIKFPPALTEVLALLRRAADRCSYASWDLHGGNFMVRGDQVVVTDPLA